MANESSEILEQRLWGRPSSVWLLLAATAALLLPNLGVAELWTLEGRWAGVCMHMMRVGDYLHPYLFGDAYYDKPVLSYWLVVACARLLGHLDETALRLPSALAGLFAVWCVYRLGTARVDRATGLTAGFLLATCAMFVFWSRVASADMLNLAGTLAAVAWYFERRERPGFLTDAVFFVLVALTSLMKGLIGPAVILLALVPDVARDGRWRTLLRPSFFAAAVIGLGVYLAPFAASSITQPPTYVENGLAMVLQENAVRYFEPFDHQAPVYVYLEFLPVYLLPWTLLLPFAGYAAVRRWSRLPEASRWATWVCLLVLGFLSGSGSRRSYYVLPVVPFAVLVIAEWLQSGGLRGKVRGFAAWGTVAAIAVLLVWFAVVVPSGFRRGGERLLVREVRQHAEREAPWESWRILICGAPPAAGYYFRTSAEPTVIPIESVESVPRLVAHDAHTVVVTKRRFAESVRSLMPTAAMFEEPSRIPTFLRSRHGSDRDVVAFVP